MRPEEVAAWAERVLAEVERAVVGKREPLRLILMAFLAGGHVLIEDVPGLAKTLAARSLARAMGLEFKRIQFTPDLLPADITGSYVFRRDQGEFEFRPGPIFAQLLLADEINRATPRTQSALLEAMQEGQVTLEGVSRPLPRPFLVVATQNPIEHEGTFPLPEAQLDRFLVRLRFGYPSRKEEVEILRRRMERGRPEPEIRRVTDADEFRKAQQALEGVHVEPDLMEYMVRIVEETRSHQYLELGASPRGTLALFLLSRARAALEGRDFVVPDDVKAVAVPVLAHRLLLKPELWHRHLPPEEIVHGILQRVPVPKVERWSHVES